MVVISSTTNEWPQSHHLDEKSSLMASTTSRLPMEKVPPSTHEPSQQQQQIQQGLKCPRCDSSNTKFCYYNNYSLSQPRHFCKACKRYWTRGGTLRNVPVGGGCRKNKRVKRQASSLEGSNTSSSTSNNITTTTTSASSANPNYNNLSSQPLMDMISSTPNHMNPLFFGLPSNPSELNLPFPGRFNPSSRVSSSSSDGYDLQPQLNALGLGFSSGLIMSGATTTDHPNGFINPNKQIQDMAVNTSNPLLASYSSIFGSSSPTISTTSPTMATLLASTFHHQKFGVKDTSKAPFDQFQTLTTTTTPVEGLQVNGNSESGNVLKGVKIEPGQSMLDWSLSYQNQEEQIGFSDPNSLYWNTNLSSVGAWHDPANIGSSVTSLI